MSSNVASAENTQMTGFPWWLALLEGIALIILGFLFLSSPGMTSLIAVQFLGIYWLVAGIFRIVSMFLDHTAWGFKLFAGIIGIIAGIVIIQSPLWSTALVGATLIIVLGVQGLIGGVFALIAAFQGAGWGAGVLGGISIIFGILLLANVWVFTFSLPWVLGVFALASGIVAIITAFKMR
ncbi:MAG: hypothetical protein HF973_12070 [Chloroflexi bacterium]|nr:hypothetical protein [Chloroflexota bacterium]